MKSIASIFKLLRPCQWLKNLFIFLPLFFNGSLFNSDYLGLSTIAFLSFSLMASSIYCLNDIQDVEADRLHPSKSERPIANGDISPSVAGYIMVALIFASFALTWLLPLEATRSLMAILGVYLLLNIAYSLKLKHYAIIDVFIIAFGFVLRIFAGGISCNIPLSPWIILMTFLISLFLAFSKRRDDVIHRNHGHIITRPNTVFYNIDFMNLVLGITAAVTIVCYILYTVSPDIEAQFSSHYVYTTSVFVIAGILRYLQITIVAEHSGSPTQILIRDRFIQGCIGCWILVFLILIYI